MNVYKVSDEPAEHLQDQIQGLIYLYILPENFLFLYIPEV
jgi:hypothetical protein